MAEPIARADASAPRQRDPLVWHLLLVLAVSAAYESLFLHHGLNVIDEGWPLYAAMRLHDGGTLYQDVFFVFPPGHLLVAWIAYGLDPPGVVMARSLYAAFTVALVGGVYLLGRRITTPLGALFGALLLAIAATSAHMQQLVFGYRYLVVSLLALLAFSEWLRRGRRPWLFVAGLIAGVSLAFRLTPAFAVSCAVGVGIVAAGGTLRSWIRDGALYAAGLALVAIPLVGWLGWSVGLDTLWLEAVVRPVAMTDAQSLPVPDLSWWPQSSGRRQVSDWWVALQFRSWTLLYAGYAIVLVLRFVRALRAGRPFESALLTAVVVWGGVYFLRSFGRSDSAHLYSALPPVCLLLGHLASLVARRASGAALWRRPPQSRLRVPALALGAALFFALWIYLGGADRPLDPAYRGDRPLAVLDERVSLRRTSKLRAIDRKVKQIRRAAGPDEVILDMTASSLLHVLSGRLGPGYADVVMPGTFLTEAEEAAFLARLQQSPPALVIWPGADFDEMPERSASASAPAVARWILANYERVGPRERFTLLAPRKR